MTTRKPLNKRLLLVPVLIGLVCFVAWIVDQRDDSKAPTVVSVALGDTARTNGLFYILGETIPFSGNVIERYEDGSLRARSNVEAGLLDGLTEGWFANGQKQIQEHFNEGVSHGKRLKWHVNGILKSEVEIVEGQLDGLFHEWHEDGSLAREIALSNGASHGLSRSWFPSGYLQARASLKSGELDEQDFFEDGQLKEGPADSTVSEIETTPTEITARLAQGQTRQ